jgi:hypothetical protein
MIAIDYLVATMVAMVGALALVMTAQQSLTLARDIHRDVAVDNLLWDTAAQLQLISRRHQTMESSDGWLGLVGQPLCHAADMPQSQWCDRHRTLNQLLSDWVVCLEPTATDWFITAVWPAKSCDADTTRRQRSITPL